MYMFSTAPVQAFIRLMIFVFERYTRIFLMNASTQLLACGGMDPKVEKRSPKLQLDGPEITHAITYPTGTGHHKI